MSTQCSQLAWPPLGPGNGSLVLPDPSLLLSSQSTPPPATTRHPEPCSWLCAGRLPGRRDVWGEDGWKGVPGAQGRTLASGSCSAPPSDSLSLSLQ